jgi:hypothetical protein
VRNADFGRAIRGCGSHRCQIVPHRRLTRRSARLSNRESFSRSAARLASRMRYCGSPRVATSISVALASRHVSESARPSTAASVSQLRSTPRHRDRTRRGRRPDEPRMRPARTRGPRARTSTSRPRSTARLPRAKQPDHSCANASSGRAAARPPALCLLLVGSRRRACLRSPLPDPSGRVVRTHDQGRRHLLRRHGPRREVMDRARPR